MKKKLLITVGAGASIDFGLPSVSTVDALFDKLASTNFSLADDQASNLYTHIRDAIQSYYDKNPKPALRVQVNFEEVLYQINLMASILSDPAFKHGSAALFSPKELPDTLYFNKERKQVDGAILSHLSRELVDGLVDNFIDACNKLPTTKSKEIADLRNFMAALSDKFDVGIITLNYDNVFTQAWPSLFTGFDAASGEFNPYAVLSREEWGFIYHLHGSIHYSMNAVPPRDLHKIMWANSPEKNHTIYSSGRGSHESVEGVSYPTSTIIAGYGKTSQVLRQPFRTYFAQVNKLVHEADSLLFLGYGFGDTHLNATFSEVRNRHRPVVVVDWADSSQDSLPFRNDNWTLSMFSTLPGNADKMSSSGHICPADIGSLKRANELEVSIDPNYPLAVWYNGLLEACRNSRKIISYL